ncbi:MAG: alpha/beta hydrolase-fold protein [Terracidiphilus sp.]
MKIIGISRSTLPILAAAALRLTGCHSALLDSPRQAPGVRMQDVIFHSVALNRDMPYRVYLPSHLAPGQKFPVVYLLHGNGGSFREFSNDSDVAHYAAPGHSAELILVMPEGGSSYYLNAALKPEDRFKDYLVNDLIADVESRFPAATGRKNRAVIGISMGGYGAINLALTRPDLFAFAGAISPAVDTPSRRFSWRRWGQSMRFRTIFGPAGSATRQASDPFHVVQYANPTVTPYIYMTAGEQEPLLEPIRRFASVLHNRHFAYEFHTTPGGHDWNEWNGQIPACFDRLLHHLPPQQ